jgi:hypothetical protein
MIGYEDQTLPGTHWITVDGRWVRDAATSAALCGWYRHPDCYTQPDGHGGAYRYADDYTDTHANRSAPVYHR